MTDLNLTGESYAHSLIAAGKVDRNSAWSFSAEDGNALLGKGDDWDSFGKVHLGLDRSASDKTKARFKYPVAKGGKLYRSGVIAAKQRASQHGDGAVEKAASSLLEQIDKPKSSLVVEHKASAFEYKFVEGDGNVTGTFEGYGSVFNNEDDGGDVMLPGAFQKTLDAHDAGGTMPKMLLNHGSMGGSPFGGNDPMADLPIGKWTKMSEDNHGLAVKGRLINLDTERSKNIYGAMKEGELSGLSIGYKARDFIRGTKPNEPRRQLKAVDLFEVSPVTFPMNARAGISTVKSAREITTIREFEDFLRDAGSFSREAAKAIAAGGFKALSSLPRDEADIGEAIAGSMQELVEKIRSFT
jgi:Escherichia/Staphylococcus phage prohead protease